MILHLFSYGTLQQKEVQLKLFGRELKMVKDILKGYQIAPKEITDEAFLKTGAAKNQRIAIQTNQQKDFIEGSVLEITEDDMKRSDSYEPKNYKRVEVVLESGKKAWVYVGQNHLKREIS